MSDNTNIQKREVTGEPERIRSGPTYVPAVDIVEQGDELLLIADVPGATAEGIDIDFERGRLTVTVRVETRQDPSTNYFLREYGIGDFVRTFQISEAIDAAKIEAEINAGVLTVHLPKAETAKSRKIAIKSN